MSAVPAGSPRCQDCVFYRNAYFGGHQCARNVSVIGVNPVTGREETTYAAWCVEERAKPRFFSRKKLCGPSGRFFKGRA